MTTAEINQRILDAGNLSELSQRATEYQNSECTVDNSGDVWDSRGHWWSDERKEQFVAWMATRFVPPVCADCANGLHALCTAGNMANGVWGEGRRTIPCGCNTCNEVGE